MKSFLRLLCSCLLGVALVLASRDAAADPIRIVIAASHTEGRAGERPLKHADDDARGVRDVFVRLGGVAPENATLLRHPSADELLHALDRAVRVAASQGGEDVSLVFYFSGHGDSDAIHLGPERLPIDVIASRLAQGKARLRILVLDACRTNDGRPKGFSEGNPFAIVLPQSDTARGTVLLHASADGEVAQESDDLGGAVFTHYWVNGLMGAADTNADGEVTLGESYGYAYEQTLWRSAVSSGVAQRPSAVLELKEAAPLVLTRTTRSSAIAFPQSADTHYVVYGLGSQTVAGDLWGSPDHRATLAVTPGRYIVHRRGNGSSSAAEVVVARGEAYPLSSREFVPFSEEALSLKGGDLVLYPDELAVGYGALATNQLVSFGQEADVRFTHAWDRWAIAGALHGGIGTFDTAYWNGHLTWIGADAIVERRIPLGWPTLRVGAGLVLDQVFQTLSRADAASLQGTPYAPENHRRGVDAGARLVAGLRLPLSRRVWVDIEARGDLLGTEVASTTTLFLRASAHAAVGWSF